MPLENSTSTRIKKIIEILVNATIQATLLRFYYHVSLQLKVQKMANITKF